MDNDNPNPRDKTQRTVASRPTRCNRTLKTIVILFLCLGYTFSIVAWNKQLIAPIQQDSVWSYSSKSAHPLDYVEPIRYIAVAGLYHSGTTNMWHTINNNTFVAKSKGINLDAFPEGYPPCGVPLGPNFTVDTSQIFGDSSGITDQNVELSANWGVMWADSSESLTKRQTYASPNAATIGRRPVVGGKKPQKKTYTEEDALKMAPPHSHSRFTTWWKHTPPQHPMMACFRPDTLYVIMVRHPKIWRESLKKEMYDFIVYRPDKNHPLHLVRRNPRRLPTLDMRFKSEFHAWSYWMNGYLGWENVSAGKNCYDIYATNKTVNCLGGINVIPSNRRNILIVRHEDYVYHPKRILAQIFSFATRGVIDAEKDLDKFDLFGQENSIDQIKKLDDKKESGFYSTKDEDWDGAKELHAMCLRLGYSCDESPELFIDQS